MSRSTMSSFVAGGAAAGTAAVVVLAAGLAAGFWPLPHPLVLAGGVGAGGVAGFMSSPGLDSLGFRAGAVAAGVLAISTELVTPKGGVGAVQLVAVASGAAVGIIGLPILRPLPRPVPRWLIGIGLVAVALVMLRTVVEGGELGHDEAAYALKARAWLSGTPDTGWSLHRGLGQSLLAAIVLPFSESAAALRLLSVVLSLGTVVAVWELGRTMRCHRVGLIAAGVFAVAPAFLRRGAEFLSDVPSTGLLLVVTILLWKWLRSTPVRNAYLYWAGAVGAVAVYIRYQSVLSLVLIAVATGIVGWGRIRESFLPLGKAAGLGLVLLVPHFLHAMIATGSPWGVILATAEAGGREYLGEGLVDYARDLPDQLAGQLGAVALLAAVAWFVWRLARGGEERSSALFLMVPCVGQFLLLGLVSHGEPRFVFFPVALAAVAAGMAADDLRRRVSPVVYRSGAVALAVAMIASLGLHGDRADRNAEARAESIRALDEAARAVRAESDGPCGIVTGSLPQMTWLSGCVTAPFNPGSVAIRLDPALDGFLLLSEEGPRQPEGELREEYLELTEGEPIVIEGEGGLGDVEVWRIR